MIKILFFSVFVSFSILLIAPVQSAEQEDRAHWEVELDPYYTNLGLYINLADEAIPDLGDKSEREIYQDLLLRSHKPRFLLLEFSVNPMPVLGAAIRRNYDHFYDDTQISSNLNVVEVLTAGFEEPYCCVFIYGQYGDLWRQ